MVLPQTFKLYYYKLVIAFCNADQSSAESWMNLIIKAEKDQPELLESLPTVHLEKLKKIRQSLKSGFLPRGLTVSSYDDSLEVVPSDQKTIALSEKELQITIAESHISRIGEIVGVNNLRLNSLEHPTEDGRCDIFCRGERVAVPIEVKLQLARHDVVSQIDKYVKSFTKDFIYNLWDQVVGVVIANGFSRYAIKELPHLGVIPIRYICPNNDISQMRLEAVS